MCVVDFRTTNCFFFFSCGHLIAITLCMFRILIVAGYFVAMAMGRSAQNQRPYPLARLSPPALQTTFSAKKLEAPRGGAVTAAADRGVHLALAGAIATMIGDFAMHPIDCIKTLQQSNSGAGLSMLGASKTIWKTSVCIAYCPHQ